MIKKHQQLTPNTQREKQTPPSKARSVNVTAPPENFPEVKQRQFSQLRKTKKSAIEEETEQKDQKRFTKVI